MSACAFKVFKNHVLRSVILVAGATIGISLIGGEAFAASTLPLVDKAQTVNQQSVAGVFAILTTDPAADSDIVATSNQLLGLGTDEEVRAAFDSLSGEIGVVTPLAITKTTQQFHQSLTDKIGSGNSVYQRQDIDAENKVFGVDISGFTHALTGDVGVDTEPTAWAETYGIMGSIEEASNGTSAFDSDAYGASVGALYPVFFNNMRLGGSLGYAGTEVDGFRGGDTSQADSYQFAVLSDYSWGALTSYLGFTYSQHNIEQERTIRVGSINRTAKAEYKAMEPAVVMGVERQIAVGNFTVSPRTSFEYSRLIMKDFNETGAGSLNLSVDNETLDNLLWQGDVTAAYLINLENNRTIVPSMRLGFAAQSGDYEGSGRSNFSGNTFDLIPLESSERDEMTLELGAGLDASLTDTMLAFAYYEGNYGASETQHTVGLGLGVNW